MEPDETRYGEIPREMIATGNWISPHLNGLRYFEKPPLGYWLNSASILAFGENDFAIRLPSALSVGLSALLIILLIRQACPREEIWAGPVAALVFLTSIEVPVIGTFGVLDSMLAAALTLTMVCFFLASQAARGSSRQAVVPGRGRSRVWSRLPDQGLSGPGRTGPDHGRLSCLAASLA